MVTPRNIWCHETHKDQTSADLATQKEGSSMVSYQICLIQETIFSQN